MVRIVFSYHVQYQIHERILDAHEIIQVVKYGRVKKIDADGTIIKIGKDSNGRIIETVLVYILNKIIIKTAYFK